MVAIFFELSHSESKRPERFGLQATPVRRMHSAVTDRSTSVAYAEDDESTSLVTPPLACDPRRAPAVSALGDRGLTAPGPARSVYVVASGDRRALFVSLLVAFVQLVWLLVCLVAFTLLGYDGGGFAGGLVSPAFGAAIAFAPSILALAWYLLTRR